MGWLSKRQLQAELMDQPDLDPAQHRAALAGLARINWWSFSASILWPRLVELANRSPTQIRILDVATGSGDVPIRLFRRAHRAGISMTIEGCDLSPFAIEQARENARRVRADVSFFVYDALRGLPLSGFDVVISSLFLHHLEEEHAIHLLTRLRSMAKQRVLVNDLLRTASGYVLARVATRLLTISHVVHVDGPRSVQNAFTLEEAKDLAARAGLRGARFSRHWPFRFLLEWSRV